MFFAEHDDVLLYLRIQSQTPFTHFENGSVALHCRSVTHGRPRLTPSPSSNRFLFSVVSDDTINKFIFAHESHKEKVNVKYLKHKNMKSICFIHSSIFSARDKTKKYYSEIHRTITEKLELSLQNRNSIWCDIRGPIHL